MSFFNCRICTGTLWGDPVDAHAPPKDGQKPSKKETAKTRSTRNKFAPRDEKDVESDLGKWSDFVHPRALDFFPDQGAVKKVFSSVSRSQISSWSDSLSCCADSFYNRDLSEWGRGGTTHM